MKFDDTAVQAIIQGRRVIGRGFFPGQQDVEIGIRLVSESQVDQARLHAHLYLDKRCKKAELTLADYANIDPETLDRETQRQVLLRAIVDIESSNPEDPEQFFASIEQVRALDTVCFQQLWDAYADWQDTVNPRLKLSDKEVDELAAALKDTATATEVLAHIAPDTLRSLVRSLALQRST